MAETPTNTQVLNVRADLNDYLSSKRTIAEYTTKALAQLKRDLKDRRDIDWSQVYAADVYLSDLNEDRCKNMIAYLAVAYVFEDYALQGDGGSQWWDLYLHYRGDYDDMLKVAKLDIDWDDSGGITDGEKGINGQRFFVK